MAFISIANSFITVGRAIKRELWLLVKDDLDDLDTRQTAIEAVTQKIVVIDEIFLGLSQYAGTTALTEVISFRAPLDFNLITFEVTQVTAGTSGNLEMDLKVGASHASLVSYMTTRPLLSFSAGNNAISSNQLFSQTLVNEGEYITIDITSIQVGQRRVQVLILGEPA